jgi:NAD dependent epimerase/dehydratase family enzyme/ligand-binding SRPBCC domain-containing protein
MERNKTMVDFVSQINARADEVFSWHQSFGATERLTPPWYSAEILRQERVDQQDIKFLKTDDGILQERTTADSINRSIISQRIKSEKQSIEHTRNFTNFNDKTLIKETIKVNLLSSILPSFIIDSMIESKLAKEFNFRKFRIENDLRQHKKFAEMPRKNIAILGAPTTLAKQFKPFFTSGGHTVYSFVKRKPYPTAREIQLNTNNNNVGLASLKAIDTVLFFAQGENTKLTNLNIEKHLQEKLKELRLMIRSFQINQQYPETFIMMSNTCVYKNLKASITEYTQTSTETEIARYFLTLEHELKRLSDKGVRVVYARTGNILNAKSGILKDAVNKQKFAFCRQNYEHSKYLNWTSLDDAIYATNHIMFDETLHAGVNICSSMTINSNDLGKLLAKNTHRSFLFTLPAFIFKATCGNIMNEKIFQGNSVYPQKLKRAGFEFSLENINDALNWETGNLNSNLY